MMNRRALLLGFLPLPAFGADFTSQLWTDVRPIYTATTNHPFLLGLADGTLPQRKFQFYLLQDGRYLHVFGRALNVLASKAPRAEWAEILNEHAIGSLKEERDLHQRLLAGFGLSRESMNEVAPAPSNYAYTNHLMVAVERLSFMEGLAAMLPCYWVYWEVGKELKKRGSKNAAYRKWIDQYAGAEYGAVVKQVLDMMNAEAEGAPESIRKSARKLFVLSARYEYMFWDMAWREENWAP